MEKVQTTDYPDAKWENGFYDIEMPDYAHLAVLDIQKQNEQNMV